jgi:predicted dehydrogenase
MKPSFTRREFLQTAGAATLATMAAPSLLAQAAPKITVAFAGVCHIHTPGYLTLAKQRPDVKIKSIWDGDPQRATRAAPQFGATAVSDVNAIWSDPEITAVIVCSETNRHHDLVLAGAKAGKHMFVEKPLGITAAESKEMADAIEKAKLIFTTGYFMRTDPRHIFLKDEVAKGNFGKITRVRGSNCHNGSLGGWFDTDYRWMADPKIAGVGAFGDLGTHKLDILMWILGDIEAVTAEIKSVTGKYGDCDETGEALFRFKSGVIGTLGAGWVDIDDPVQLLISGTDGHAMIVGGQLYYQSRKVPDSNPRAPYSKLPPAQPPPMQQFLDAVAGSKNQPLVPVREAAARVSVMQAMYESAKDHKWVTVT